MVGITDSGLFGIPDEPPCCVLWVHLCNLISVKTRTSLCVSISGFIELTLDFFYGVEGLK